MNTRGFFIAGSTVAHFALAFGLGRIEVKKSHAATAIEIADVKKPKKALEPAKVDPTPAKPEPKTRTRSSAPPKIAENTPPPTTAAARTEALPDFGLSLSGGVGGDGVAIPAGGGAGQALGPAKAAPVRKALSAMPSTASASGCEEPAVKPKPRSVPQPAYTAAARSASIEGKVRVRLTVDETGKVVEVTVIQGLGYGLDEAAVAAARTAEFEPATQCGKPVRATFTISMRFSAA